MSSEIRPEGRVNASRVVILAAGRGTRMREARQDVVLDPAQAAMADLGLKAMIPLHGRPFLDYVLSALADAGYGNACLVVGREHDRFADYYTRIAPPSRINLTLAIQHVASGTADALASAESFTGSEPFVMINSDNYYRASTLRALRTLGEPGLIGFDSEHLQEGTNISADRLAKYAAVSVSPDGYLQRIVEKPDLDLLPSPASNLLISMNCWRFSPEIFTACRAIAPSARHELELADAVQYAVDALRVRFRVVSSDAAVLDLSNRTDIAPVAARLAAVHVET